MPRGIEQSPDATRRGELVAFVALFAVLAAAYTWPLVRDAAGTFVYPAGESTPLALADSLLTSWILSWVAHAVWAAPLDLFGANAFFPLDKSLALSEHLLAGGLLVLPLDLLHHDPVLNNNVMLLATFAIGGAGTALLMRELGASRTAAVAAGVFAFFGPLRLAQLGHVHALSLHWLPVVFAGLHRTMRTGSTASALAFAVALLLQGLSSVYLGYYSAIAVATFAGVHWATGCPAAVGGRTRVVLAGVAAGALVIPAMLPYAEVRSVFDLARQPHEAWMYSARGITYLGAFLDPLEHLRQRFVADGWPVAVVGVALAAFAFTGLVRGGSPASGGRRVAVAYALLAMVMALLSLGPSMQLYPSLELGVPGPHALLARVLPGFDALRVPMRATGITVLALAVLAGFGVEALMGGTSGRRRHLRVGLLALVLLVESWHPMLRTEAGLGRDPGAVERHRWLAAQPVEAQGPVVALPLGVPWSDAQAMALSTLHWQPLVNGYSGFLPAGFYLRRVLAGFPDDRSRELLAGLGVRWAIINDRAYPRDGASPCRREQALRSQQMRIVRRDADGCVVALEAEATPPVGDRGSLLRVARVAAADGAELVIDDEGTLAAPWMEAVDRTRTSWLDVELTEPGRVRALVVHLGRHFGIHLRQYRVEVSNDRRNWRVVRDEPVGEAPLVAYRRDPRTLQVVIEVPEVEARHVRLVRTADRGDEAFDLWSGWQQWGATGIEVRGRR